MLIYSHNVRYSVEFGFIVVLLIIVVMWSKTKRHTKDMHLLWIINNIVIRGH